MNRREFLQIVAGTSILAGLPAGCAIMKKENEMKIDNLAMPPLNTTLMGVVKGVMDYYNIDTPTPMVFGISGHAFLINIHKQLCPSGPYCWKHTGFTPLVKNLGLQMTNLGFYSPQNSQDDRANVEKKLRNALDSKIPCSLLNLENQLITGYDANGFFTAQPWAPKVDFPPARLSFGTWQELGEGIHISFYTFEKVKQADQKISILESLDYAVDLHTNPSKYSLKDYGIGPDAYTNWINAAEEYGSSHGNWWNATVWSECRKMASGYFSEIQREYDCVSRPASELTKSYADIADILGKLSNKKMDTKEKIELLKEVKSKEAAAIKKVAALAATLRSSDKG